MSDELQGNAIDALTDPRDRLLVVAGRIQAIGDIAEILTDHAGIEGAEGRAAIGAIAEELQSLIYAGIREKDRLAKQLAPAPAGPGPRWRM